MSTKYQQWFALRAFLFIGFLGMFCCEPSQPYIQIKLKNLPPDTQSISVCANIQGESRIVKIDNSLGELRVVVPSLDGFSGPLDVLIEVNDGDGCSTLLLTEKIQIQNNQGVLEVDAPSSNQVLCKVEMKSTGIGQGSFRASPAGLPSSCEKNAYYFPKGQSIQVQVEPGANSHVASSISGCDQQSGAMCNMGSLQKPGKLSVLFNLGLCTTEHWCWENPLPQGNTLYGIWGSSDGGSIWAVGEQGTILRHDKDGFYSPKADWQTPFTNEPTLYRISGSDSQNAWAVGQSGLILHWNGASWQEVGGLSASAKADLFAVSGQNPNQLFVAGGSKVIGTARLKDLTKGWIVDNYDWSYYAPTANGDQMRDILWLPSLDGYSNGLAVGTNPLTAKSHVYRWDGTTWSSVSLTTCQMYNLYSLWSTSGKLWFTTSDGKVLTAPVKNDCAFEFQAPTSKPLHSLFGIDEKTMWAVGSGGQIIGKRDGNWSGVQSPASADLFSVWGRNANEFWAVGTEGVILKNLGVGWEYDESMKVQEQLSPRNDLSAIAGRDSDHIWAVGKDGLILHWNGRSWQAEPNPDPKGRDLYAVWAEQEDVWISGQGGLILRKKLDQPWVEVAGPAAVDLTGVTTGIRVRKDLSNARKKYLMVTSDHKVWTWEIDQPIEWASASTPSVSNALWAKDEYACVGGSSTAGNMVCTKYVNTGLWDLQYTPKQGKSVLHSIWGTGLSDIWAVGDGIVIHRFMPAYSDTHDSSKDINEWEVIHEAAAGPLESYLGGCQSGNIVWIVGNLGQIYKYDLATKTWSPMKSGTKNNLSGIWCGPTGDIIAVGEKGTILRYSP